jgi:hypothetical protein
LGHLLQGKAAVVDGPEDERIMHEVAALASAGVLGSWGLTAQGWKAVRKLLAPK